MMPEYFLIYCEEDTSYSVVPAEDVVFRGITPKIGQEVKFYYDSSERSYDGKVVDLGEGTESYSTLVKKQNQLNSQKKAQKSFDASKPRTAALKQRERMQNLAIRKRQKPADEVGHASKQPKLPVPQGGNNEKDSPTDSGKEDSRQPKQVTSNQEVTLNGIVSDDTDDSDSACNNEERNKRHSKAADVRTVRNAPRERDAQREKQAAQREKQDARREKQSPVTPSQRSTGEASTSGASSPFSPPMSVNDWDAGDDEDMCLGESVENEISAPSDLRVKCSRKRRARRVKQGVNVEIIKFDGQQLKYTTADKDSNVIELYAGSNVYLKKTDIHTVRRHCNTTTKVCRYLMDAIFTDQALLNCSLGGQVSTGGGPGKYVQRTALDPNAVSAIIEFTTKYCGHEKRNFPHATDTSRITHAMSSKLNELRYGYRMHQEDEKKSAEERQEEDGRKQSGDNAKEPETSPPASEDAEDVHRSQQLE